MFFSIYIFDGCVYYSITVSSIYLDSAGEPPTRTHLWRF